MILLTRKTIQIVCFSLIISSSVLLLSVGDNAKATQDDASEQTDEQIQVGEAGIQVEGRLVPIRFANLAMRSSGSVEELFVQEGEWVERGQKLLRQGGEDRLLAGIAAAEMELLLAQQGLDALYRNADLERAEAEKELAQAHKEFETAEYKVSSLKRPTPQLTIDQSYANMLLAENALNKGRDDFSRTEKKFANPNHFLWLFFNRRQVRLLLTSMERSVISMQARYEDSIKKYEDLTAPVDKIDLAIAEADLDYAQARLTDAEQKYASLIDGPDPDEVASAQARITAAEANLRASQNALQELELVAPFAGTVVELNVKSGEWVEVGQPLVVLAELSEWVVETEDLTEIQVPQIRSGQGATLIPEALPELSLTGKVDSISRISEIKSGDVTYTARILLDDADPRLRWGMTVTVNFEEG
jgi:multidrug resistance efflux pump